MQPHNFMRVVSVDVGLPREVLWKGRIVSTGIFKEPVGGRVMAYTRGDAVVLGQLCASARAP
jgi:hypothetical protein